MAGIYQDITVTPMTIRPRNRKLGATFHPKTSLKILIFLFFIVLIGSLLICAWSNVRTINLGYEITKLHDERSALLELRKKLALELANLRSPERIEAIATNELGLSPPNRKQVIMVQ
ncbi:MAG: cell division protein FtsL [Deltaproteobacteria bacterium]|nr:cell division protein FtsL [Deltaproteobacteria bacterium]